MSELPKGWIKTKLGDICSKPQYGYTTRAASAGNIKFLRTTDITKGLNWLSVPYCEANPEKPEQYLLQSGDIVISRAGSVGFSALIESVPESAVFASYLIRFRPLEGVIGKYLKRYLESDYYWQQITEKAAGNALQNVNAQKLADLDVVVAPVAEQTRIAAKLDELLAQVDTLKARIDGIPALLKRFRQSVLAAAVSGRLTEEWRIVHPNNANETAELVQEILRERQNAFQIDMDRVGRKRKYNLPATTINEGLPEIPASWALVSVDSLASKVVDGVHKKPEYKESGVPFITVKNLTAGREICFAETKFVSTEDHAEFYKRANPEKGDILISKDGTLGVVRQVKTSAEFSIFVSVALIKPALRNMSNYLELALKSPQLQAQMVGVGTGLQHIHLTDLRQDAIPLPPKDEQTEIVRRVEQLFAFADQLEARVKAAQSCINHLTQSILAKAFRGELVPQDPNDEPASVLLERIKAQRAATPKAKRGRRAATPS